MAWDGRSSKPAATGVVDTPETPTVVTFAEPFRTTPTVTIPPTSEGVTATPTEITPEGFVLLVEHAADTEPSPVEWIATTSTSQED